MSYSTNNKLRTETLSLFKILKFNVSFNYFLKYKIKEVLLKKYIEEYLLIIMEHFQFIMLKQLTFLKIVFAFENIEEWIKISIFFYLNISVSKYKGIIISSLQFLRDKNISIFYLLFERAIIHVVNVTPLET